MLKENYEEVQKKITEACKRAGRNREEVTLIAVSKTKPVEMLSEIYDLGERNFGENKVQELTEKEEVLPKDIHWHMIGHLQRNKVKYIAGKVALIHSVDSLRLAKTISEEAVKHNCEIPILIEVNVAGEESKMIFGEVTPKSLAKEMPEKVATAVSPFLVLLMALMTPLTWLFTQWKKLLGHFVHSGEADTITEGELMTMVSEAENDGELTDRESELIRSAIEFDDVEVEEILTPRVDVVAVEDDIPLEELAQTFAESGYSRLPVYHGTIDNIIGVVHEKDFYIARLKKATKIDDLVVPTLYTTGSTQISQLLRTLREQHHHLAVVVDEYGGTEGIITLEDILEELVGEIWDEHDEVTEDFRKQSDGSWLVSGSASVDDLYEELDLPEEEDIDSNTVNGLVQEKTCHLPKVGDRFTLGEYDGVVTRTAKRRVTEVRLTPAAPAEDAEKDDEKDKRFSRIAQRGESR